MPKGPADVLLERETELELVDSALASARRGFGRFVVVEAQAGIGKTSLVREARNRAAACGMATFSARGGELETHLPFGVARQLLEPVVLQAADDKRERLFSGPAAAGRAVFVDPPSLGDQGHSDLYATVHALFWLTAAVAAEQPVLLTIDDAHWADPASLRWLSYLAKRRDDLAIALLVTVRTSHGRESPHGELVDELISDSSAQLLRLAPLSEPAVTTLVRAGLSLRAETAFCQACYTSTKGNPLLLRELIATLVQQRTRPLARLAALVPTIGPETLGRRVLRGVRQLGTDASAVAEAVSILSDRADSQNVLALTGLSASAFQQAVGALTEADILERAEPLAFVHPIVRAAVYSAMPVTEQDRAHSRAAQLLSERAAPPEDCALHLLRTRPAGDPWRVSILRAAGARAAERGAPDEAAAYLQRALSEPPDEGDRVRVLLELGRNQLRLMRQEGLERLREARAAARDPEQRTAISLELGRALSTIEDSASAAKVFAGAMSDPAAADHPLAVKLEEGLITAALNDLGSSDAGRERYELFESRLLQIGRPEPSALAMLAMLGAARLDPRERVIGLGRDALRDRTLLCEENVRPLTLAATALTWAEEFALVLEVWDRALSAARQHGSRLLRAVACGFRAKARYRVGDLGGAAADARKSLALHREHGSSLHSLGLSYPLAVLVEAEIERGQASAANHELQVAGLAGPLPRLWQYNVLLYARARLLLQLKNPTGALTDLVECGDRLNAWGVHNPAIIPWRSTAALAWLALGDAKEARRLAHEEVDLAGRWGAPRSVGLALRVAGSVEGGPHGLDFLRNAVTVLERSPARLEYAYALADLGGLLRRRRQRAEARGILHTAYDEARRCGAVSLAQRAHEELLATGARPRRLDACGIEALTTSERRVAELAAEGLTNREIAQALFITKKTVETHLGHIYGKLGIRGRSQLQDLVRDRTDTTA